MTATHRLPKAVLATLALGATFSPLAFEMRAQQQPQQRARQAMQRSSENASAADEAKPALPEPSGLASPPGFENNYTKDPWNYSRAYLFDFLPFYDMGLGPSYHVNASVGVAYWVVNGARQTELAFEEPQSQPVNRKSRTAWQYGGFADLGYSLDFNFPSNHLFRNRSTTFKVNELDLNMAAVGVKKVASQVSRWGMELTAHGGKDSEAFGFSATAPNVRGSDWLRHFGLANVSYLAPVGKGLTVQAGLFNSFIGYDSLYAKDNFSYTRPWGADYTPYLMFGVNASYPFSKKIAATAFVINGYWHLARANNVPSSGGQLAYRATEHLTFKETILFGPHQSNTSLEFWRFFSDSILEWKTEQLTAALEYQIGTEKVDVPGKPRALWTAAQLPVHWVLGGPWSVTVRPEFCWDREGRWTGFKQLVKALTTTLEYRVPYRQTNTIVRLEYRFDDSRGKGGGFFKDGEVSPGVVSLTPTQHLLILGLIFTFDSH